MKIYVEKIDLKNQAQKCKEKDKQRTNDIYFKKEQNLKEDESI